MLDLLLPFHVLQQVANLPRHLGNPLGKLLQLIIFFLNQGNVKMAVPHQFHIFAKAPYRTGNPVGKTECAVQKQPYQYGNRRCHNHNGHHNIPAHLGLQAGHVFPFIVNIAAHFLLNQLC